MLITAMGISRKHGFFFISDKITLLFAVISPQLGDSGSRHSTAISIKTTSAERQSTAGKHHKPVFQLGHSFIFTIDQHATHISIRLFFLSLPLILLIPLPRAKSQRSLRQPETTVCLIKNVDENAPRRASY